MIISIICPCYNEVKYIEATLDSFLKQQCENFELEILICDGMSIDGTRAIVELYANKFPQVRLIDNVKRKTPFAFNVGIAAAKGEYVAILGAHSAYKSNYVQACYDALLQHQAIACTGRVITQAAFDTATAKLSEWVMLSSFGVSGNSFRVMKEGYVHSVNFPIVKKQALLDLGGYDESLERNQDNDMNQRLLDAGYKLYCTWNTTAFYRPPASVKKLLQYGYRGGFWNAKSFYTHRKSMRWHHFIPFVFTTTICLLAIATIIELVLFSTAYMGILLLLLFALHLAAGSIATIRSLQFENHPLKALLPLIFFAFHFSYGWGSVRGFLK